MNAQWQKVALKAGANLREALQVIDTSAMQIALVVDDDQRLLGTITDGDIRRALLRGEDMTTPVESVMNANPITGLSDEDRAIWQRTMLRHHLQHLPILNMNGHVVDLARYTPPQEPNRDNPIILMAGGLGTRLRPLTENQPKPLLRVGSKPILETIIENFRGQGFYRIYLSINYMGDMIRDYFGRGDKWDVEISYLEEKERLGTAGALSLLPAKPDLPMIVMNGDLLTNVDFVRLLDFHERQQACATLCVREYSYQVPYGVVKVDDYTVEMLKEKPVEHHFVNAGIYALNPDVLQRIPSGEFYDMTTLLDTLISEKRKVSGFPLRDYWMDIGRMDDYERADSEYKDYFA